MRITALFCLLLATSFAMAEDRPPNILLIMADDLGADCLPVYGNTIYSTPHLDRLAGEGAVFENAYATPVCSPTRSMIMTGLYPNRTGILERMDSPADRKNHNNRLPAHIKTFGHLFKEAGYATAIAGKWHLGHFQRYPDQPTSHGFDEHCLWVQFWDDKKRSRYYAPCNWENSQYVEHSKEVFGPDYYCDFLIDFMERNREQPFLAYFPMNLIHGPLITPPGDQTAAEIPFPENLGKNERLNGRMVHYMDGLVGRLLQTLEDLELSEETIVIFTGDNGTSPNLVSPLGDFHLRGAKRTMNEAGTRVPFLAKWPGRIPPGERDALFCLADILPTLASFADIPLTHDVDGLDLSHSFYDLPGEDREFIAMAFEGDCYFVRDKRFRLHEDGRLYDAPLTDIESRYHFEPMTSSEPVANDRARLLRHLEEFMAIQQTDTSYHIVPFGTDGDSYKNAQQAKAKREAR